MYSCFHREAWMQGFVRLASATDLQAAATKRFNRRKSALAARGNTCSSQIRQSKLIAVTNVYRPCTSSTSVLPVATENGSLTRHPYFSCRRAHRRRSRSTVRRLAAPAARRKWQPQRSTSTVTAAAAPCAASTVCGCDTGPPTRCRPLRAFPASTSSRLPGAVINPGSVL